MKKRNKIKKMLIYFIAVLLFILLFIPAFNLLSWKFSDFKPTLKPLIIGHRGAAGIAPENTLTAIDSGIVNTADFVEIDVRETSDGELIIMHDESVERTTNGKGKVRDLKLSEIKSLNANKFFPLIKENVTIPTLKEVLLKIKQSKTDLLIEIKDPELYPNLVNKLVLAIKETGTDDRVLINSFNYEVIKKVKAELPHIRVGIFRFANEKLANVEGVEYICPSYYSLLYFPSIIDKIKKKGCKVFVWTVDNETIMKYLISKKVDGIITDRPDKLKQLLEQEFK